MRTTRGHKIDFIQDVKINNTIYHVVVREEVNQETPCMCQCGRFNSTISNSLSLRDPMEEVSLQSECSEHMERLVGNANAKTGAAIVISPENTMGLPEDLSTIAVGGNQKKWSQSTSRHVASTIKGKEKATDFLSGRGDSGYP
ncbi:hypothetical protein VNO80_15967 [Phaseolus coccineus]|uniref:Uncharacterized protein n=1 Tax=Phaseolus coccineus TaxID=3886 RepID=A0AAN9MR77_PHACN